MSMDTDQLKTLYPLDSMRPEHLDALVREGEGEELGRNEVLFREGDTDEHAYYLLSGEVEGAYSDGRTKSISANSIQGRYAVGDLQPRRFTATISSLSGSVLRFDRNYLEKVITFDQLVRSGQLKSDPNDPDASRWAFRLLQSKALRKVPAGSLERLFTRFEEIPVTDGQAIIREGDDGDYYYVIKEGAAAVSQLQDSGPAVVAYLVRGDSFGEDALLSNGVRNASVNMIKDGLLMRLAKSDFGELLKQPVVEWITPGKASIYVRKGAGVIDVRMREEFEERAIKGALNLPLYRLREHLAELDKKIRYVCYCNTGERSAAAAFILNKMGFEAVALAGGLSAMVKQVDKKG